MYIALEFIQDLKGNGISIGKVPDKKCTGKQMRASMPVSHINF